jgi:hypothetical protein
MTRHYRRQSQLAFALALMLVLAGFAGTMRAMAQDATPVAQTEVLPVEDDSTTPVDAVETPIPTTDESTPEAADPGVDPASVIVDPTQEAGTPTATSAIVTVFAYLCATDPGNSDPVSAGCTAGSGVPYAATDNNGLNVTQSTDGSGSTSFASVVGASFDVIQQASAATSGYVPLGDGHLEVISLQGDTTLTFINVAKLETGRVQIVAGLCPTSEQSRTEWHSNQPSTFGAAAFSCGPNVGAVFTLSSDALSDGSWAIRIEADGTWRGYVPVGEYVVTSPDGFSTNLSVASAGLAVGVAITFVQQEDGTLLLEHFLCSDGIEGEYVEVDPAGDPDASCVPAATIAYVTDVAEGGPSTPILVAQNGSTPRSLKPGEYEVDSQNGLASGTASVIAGQTTTVRLLTVATTGAIAVDGFICPDGVTPTSQDEFSTQCTEAWTGKTFTITPDAGVPFTMQTDGSGVASNDAVVPGAYSLSGSNVCGIFAGGIDASFGFNVTSGNTTGVSVYGCFDPDDGTGGNAAGGNASGGGNNNTGGNGSNTGNTIGGDGTGMSNSSNDLPYASNSASGVTALPNTGTGSDSSLPLMPLGIFFAAALMAGIGIRLRRHAI